MAQLWFKPKDAGLTMLPLSGAPVSLSVIPPQPSTHQPLGLSGSQVLLENVPHPDTNDDRWLLFFNEAAAIWVDGVPQKLGIYHLSDNQEILIKGAGVVVLTTEKPPHKSHLPESATDVICPRCKTEITPGSDAVQCPACGIWHHEHPDLPCWTYEHSTHCALCSQVTDLDAGLQRIPEGL